MPDRDVSSPAHVYYDYAGLDGSVTLMEKKRSIDETAG